MTNVTIVAPAPKIIDVSVAQAIGSIDAAKAKADGVVGLIVRAEYGTHIDANFHAWVEWGIQNGFHVGAYVFQMTDADPQDEVRVLLGALGSYPLLYGVSLDLETRNNASPGNITTWAKAFIGDVEQARSEPFGLVYTAYGFWTSLGDVATKDEYWASKKLWIANYGVQTPMVPAPWKPWLHDGGPALWQRFGNTIWQNIVTRESKWGPACPGSPNQWKRIASAYAPNIAWSSGEVDVSVLPGADDSPLLVTT